MPAGAVTARVNRRHEQVLARPFRETLLWARPLRRPLLPTGRVKRCLNLGSYNYLGFAGGDEYCTPRVLDTMAKLGWAMCSARVDAGAYYAPPRETVFLPAFLLWLDGHTKQPGIGKWLSQPEGHAYRQALHPACCSDSKRSLFVQWRGAEP